MTFSLLSYALSGRCVRFAGAVVIALLSACQVSVQSDIDWSGKSVSEADLDRYIPVSATVGQLVIRGAPEITPDVVSRVQQYSNARSAAAAGFLGDDLLIKTRFGQTAQLHRLRDPRGMREQITFFAEPVGEVAVPPVAEPSGFIFGRDVGGSEFYQLFWFDLETATARLLTDGKSRYGNAVFDSAGVRFAYSTTERDGVATDIHINDLEGNKQVAFESDGGFWYPLQFSPDGQRLLIGNYVSINESTVHEVDLTSGETQQLFADLPPASVPGAAYVEGGRAVVFATDAGSEFVTLRRLDRESGELSPLSGDVDWNVEDFAVTADGNRLAYVVNEGGLSRLVVKNLATGITEALPELPNGVVYGIGFNAAGDALRLTINRPTAPGEAYVLTLDERSLERWTFSEIGGLDTDRFVEPQLVSFPTFDSPAGEAGRRQIPAFYFRPQGPGPFATIIYIHGGPEAQYRPYFSSTLQYFAAELGVAILAPNVRGSNGYGKSYLKLDNGRLREDSVKDIGAALDWVAEQPELDSERVAVYGGSYGGYMVLASLTNYPERIAAGMESVGISNFVTFLENTQPYRQDLRRVEYGDERDPEMRAFLEQISPLNRVDQIRVPLLITQGANDPRVPASESDQIAVALARRDIPVWYLLAKDEGHGFRKKGNRRQNTAAMGLFLERHLLGGSADAGE
ncbi:MAG: S9 family peptidase [Pseudomonadota bacterium]